MALDVAVGRSEIWWLRRPQNIHFGLSVDLGSDSPKHNLRRRWEEQKLSVADTTAFVDPPVYEIIFPLPMLLIKRLWLCVLGIF